MAAFGSANFPLPPQLVGDEEGLCTFTTEVLGVIGFFLLLPYYKPAH